MELGKANLTKMRLKLGRFKTVNKALDELKGMRGGTVAADSARLAKAQQILDALDVLIPVGRRSRSVGRLFREFGLFSKPFF